MKRRIWGVILAQVVTGIALIAAGATSYLWLIGVAILFIFAAMPIERSNSMVVVQTKVDPSILGRVQSVDQLLSTSAIPLAFVTIATAIIAYQYGPLRNIETELPDMISEEEILALNNPEQEVSHAAA